MMTSVKKAFLKKISRVEFNISDQLVTEGTAIKHVYLIKEGQCKVFCSTNPADLAVSVEG